MYLFHGAKICMDTLEKYLRGLCHYLLGPVVLSLAFSSPVYALKIEDTEAKSLTTENGVRHLRVPGFDDSGMMAWELFANEVNFQRDGVYEAFDLVLDTMTGFNESNAKSKQGLFNPNLGQAWGESFLEVQGKGFWAKGKKWTWANKIESGDQLMAFKESGEVLFEDNLLIENNKAKKDPIPKKVETSLFNTHTSANYIEILELSPNQNRFLLEGQVLVKSESLEIKCTWMEILFEKDANTSRASSSMGKIGKIIARGKVAMKQPGRRSYADELVIETSTESAVLKGNARVEDDEYGLAKGNEIVLEKGKRRAKVIGGKDVRPSLQLPEIPDFGFPK